ncbi:hypothetical protein BGZ54_010293 [Gamsiella multidivaricata]|nr:hypothetical protein BGZ54_010293 [Gamsiella multidivaricata]
MIPKTTRPMRTIPPRIPKTIAAVFGREVVVIVVEEPPPFLSGVGDPVVVVGIAVVNEVIVKDPFVVAVVIVVVPIVEVNKVVVVAGVVVVIMVVVVVVVVTASAMTMSSHLVEKLKTCNRCNTSHTFPPYSTRILLPGHPADRTSGGIVHDCPFVIEGIVKIVFEPVEQTTSASAE